jgi:FkbM family methyltransferase
MNIIQRIARPEFFRFALMYLRILPRLIFTVRGWPNVLADGLRARSLLWQSRRQGKPYLLHTNSGADCLMQSGTSSWSIFLEIFVFKIYQRVDEDIRRANIIIDIGANVGLFAVHASILNPKVQIHAFEPFLNNLEQMKVNFVLNQNNHVRVYAYAVSNQSGEAPLYFTPGDDSGCSLNAMGGQSVSVATVHVNDLFKICNIPKCDLLKMDCEGTELAILRAVSPDILTNIGAIIMEYHNAAEVPEILDILKHAGFECEISEETRLLYAGKTGFAK